jgi:catechol 2,3-dioxygenase-like lactoylglutathione lyase family enzyme
MSDSKTASTSKPCHPRRAFIKQVLAAGAAVSATSAGVSASSTPVSAGSTFTGGATAGVGQESGIGALDHVAIPIQNVEEMVSFYRALGFGVRESGRIISIHFANQKINFHRPSLWQSGTFTLRAAEAQPPCGDFCWVWEGTPASLAEMLGRADAEIVAEGERSGGRDGGNAVGQSVYTRDPDGNLLEFIRYV